MRRDEEIAKQLERAELDEQIAKELYGLTFWLSLTFVFDFHWPCLTFVDFHLTFVDQNFLEADKKKLQEEIEYGDFGANPSEIISHTDRDYVKDLSNKLSKINLKQVFSGHKIQVEKVWKQDLAEKFEAKWAQLQSKYR